MCCLRAVKFALGTHTFVSVAIDACKTKMGGWCTCMYAELWKVWHVVCEYRVYWMSEGLYKVSATIKPFHVRFISLTVSAHYIMLH